MSLPYSYSWYITQFESAKDEAEKFILSIDEAQFLQSPGEGRWCIAECYSHLINFGEIYYENLARGFSNSAITSDDPGQAFPPRWIWQKAVNFFEPPYKIKMKTFNQMEPDPVAGYSRIELLDEYVNLQEQFIAQLEKGRNRKIDLQKSKVQHPMYSWVKLTLSECFALAEVHQRRHQWQAKQTAKMVGSGR